MNTIEMSDTVLSAHELLEDLIRHYGDLDITGEIASSERVLLARMKELSGKLEQVSLELCVDAVVEAVAAPSFSASWPVCNTEGKGV